MMVFKWSKSIFLLSLLMSSFSAAHAMVCTIAFSSAATATREIPIELKPRSSANPEYLSPARNLSLHHARLDVIHADIQANISRLREVSVDRDQKIARERTGDAKKRIMAIAVLSRVLPLETNQDPNLSITEKIDIALQIEAKARENDLISPLRMSHYSRYRMYRDGSIQIPPLNKEDPNSKFMYEVLELNSPAVTDAFHSYRQALQVPDNVKRKEAIALALERVRSIHTTDVVGMYLERLVESDFDILLAYVESIDTSLP